MMTTPRFRLLKYASSPSTTTLTGGEVHYRNVEFYLHVRTKADVDFDTVDDNAKLITDITTKR